MKNLALLCVLVWLGAACGEPEGNQESRRFAAFDGGRRTGEPQNTQPVAPPETGYLLDDTLRLNQIQFKGSHNSYHLTPAAPKLDMRYDMPPLAEQLERHGVRAVELDLHYYEGEFYVYHLPVDDDRSTCPRLRDCLAEMLAWSQAHPGHQPLTVYFDFRDEWDAEKLIDHLDELDALIAGLWPRERLLVPDDVTGESPDLASAVQTRGWPTLGAVRGKTMFVLWSFGDAPWRYAYNGASLSGRHMFVAATEPGWRHAVVLGMDTAHEQEGAIRDAVSRGYLVRTRSDDLPGRGGDFPVRLAAALRSGAQAILTDYPAAGSLEGYVMRIPGGDPSRCNPVTGPPACPAHAVENPALRKQVLGD